MDIGRARQALANSGSSDVNARPMEAPIDDDEVDGGYADSSEKSEAAKPSGGKTVMPAGKWARYAGTLGAGLTVTVSGAIIRKGGHKPNQPDDSDVDLLRDALEEGLKLRFGDGEVPWWLGAALAAGGVYAGMRVGAEKLAPELAVKDAGPEPESGIPQSVGGISPPVTISQDSNGAFRIPLPQGRR